MSAPDIRDLRQGFESDNDSVMALADFDPMANEEERAALLESGRGNRMTTTKPSPDEVVANGTDRAFRAVRTLLVGVAVVLVLAVAASGGGYYAMSQSSGSGGDLNGAGVDVKFTLGENAPTPSPTKVPTFTYGFLTGNDDGRIDYGSMTEDEQKELFDLFIASYSKNYSGDEDTMTRFKQFKKNLKVIDERNALEKARGGSAVHGVTKFSDLDDDEFQSTYLTASPNGAASGAIMTEVPSYVGTQDSVSWEGLYTKGIHDQGYCGACWAYSVTEQMEADAIRLGLITLNTTLSAQQILSCDTASFGCGGGWTERAYQYVQSAGGVALEEDYPYTSFYDMTGSCKEDPSTFFMTTDGYYTVGSEQAMIDYIKSTGPLSACVDASNWATYVKGIISVCGQEVDHCVQVIGVDTGSEDGYFLIRNSWGTEWGEGGYG